MSEPKVDAASETWKSTRAAIETELVKLRLNRDQIGADIRQLDRDLGGIKSLERILELPAKQAKKPAEPIRGSGVRVPGLSTHIGEPDG